MFAGRAIRDGKMEQRHQELFEKVEGKFAARRFEEAAQLAVGLIQSAATVSGAEVREVGQKLLNSYKLKPFFRNSTEGAAAGAFYVPVGEALERALGADDILVAQFRVLQAGVASSRQEWGTAADLLRRSLDTFISQFGLNDPRTMALRDNLAIQYRNGREPRRAEELYTQTGVCEHLQPLEEYLRDSGAKVMAVCRPWTNNCRTWVYFENVVLDLAAIRKKIPLAECVVDHVHRGTVDGAEQGFVCSEHHDGVMGAHPDVAPDGARRIE
jgi:hypothetical protein